MDQLRELYSDPVTFQKLTQFLSLYGMEALQEALDLYTDSKQQYVFKTKTSVTSLNISDIYYLEIQGHQITIHTQTDTYQKYGTLINEMKVLGQYGFIRCSQSCIVSISKIIHITQNQITLSNNATLHISRNCTAKVLFAFYSFRNQ